LTYQHSWSKRNTNKAGRQASRHACMHRLTVTTGEQRAHVQECYTTAEHAEHNDVAKKKNEAEQEQP